MADPPATDPPATVVVTELNGVAHVSAPLAPTAPAAREDPLSKARKAAIVNRWAAAASMARVAAATKVEADEDANGAGGPPLLRSDSIPEVVSGSSSFESHDPTQRRIARQASKRNSTSFSAVVAAAVAAAHAAAASTAAVAPEPEKVGLNLATRFNEGAKIMEEMLASEHAEAEAEAAAAAGGTKGAGDLTAGGSARPPKFKLTLSKRIFLLLETPSSSREAMLVYSILMITIFMSVVAFCVSTMQSIEQNESVYSGIEYYCTAVFTIDIMIILGQEFFLRLATSPDKRRFLTSFFNIIDFVAMMPTYMDLIVMSIDPGASGQILKDLRVLRLVRLLKIAKTYSGIQIFILTMERSIQPALMLLFFLSFGVVLFSSLLWYCERSVNPNFPSVPQSFWWGIVTFATVGYGGRWVAGVAIFSAMVLLALPVGVIGSNFSDVLKEFKEEEMALEKRHRALMERREKKKEERASLQNAAPPGPGPDSDAAPDGPQSPHPDHPKTPKSPGSPGQDAAGFGDGDDDDSDADELEELQEVDLFAQVAERRRTGNDRASEKRREELAALQGRLEDFFRGMVNELSRELNLTKEQQAMTALTQSEMAHTANLQQEAIRKHLTDDVTVTLFALRQEMAAVRADSQRDREAQQREHERHARELAALREELRAVKLCRGGGPAAAAPPPDPPRSIIEPPVWPPPGTSLGVMAAVAAAARQFQKKGKAEEPARPKWGAGPGVAAPGTALPAAAGAVAAVPGRPVGPLSRGSSNVAAILAASGGSATLGNNSGPLRRLSQSIPLPDSGSASGGGPAGLAGAAAAALGAAPDGSGPGNNSQGGPTPALAPLASASPPLLAAPEAAAPEKPAAGDAAAEQGSG